MTSFLPLSLLVSSLPSVTQARRQPQTYPSWKHQLTSYLLTFGVSLPLSLTSIPPLFVYLPYPRISHPMKHNHKSNRLLNPREFLMVSYFTYLVKGDLFSFSFCLSPPPSSLISPPPSTPVYLLHLPLLLHS